MAALALILLLSPQAAAAPKPAKPLDPATALKLAAVHERKARKEERLARKNLRCARRLAKKAARTAGKGRKRLLTKARSCRKRAKAHKRRARRHRKKAKRLRKLGAPRKPTSTARRAAVPLGTAVSWNTVQADAQLRDLFLKHFDQLTPENELKWYAVHPGRFKWSFGAADAMVDWAIANGKAVRGHTLIYTKQNPAWVESGIWTRDMLLRVMRDHITMVMEHFKGRIHEWDVVNEAIDSAGNWQDNIWLRVIGSDYVDYAFRYAREADRSVRLYYNDWGLDAPNTHTDAVIAMVQTLKNRGVPIDGVGIQGHVTNQVRGSETSLADVKRRITSMDLSLAVTEMDVRADDGNLQTQAAVYRDYAKACRLQPRCTSFTTWGIVDKYSWYEEENPAWVPLPFDNSYQPKPAWSELRDWIKAP